MNTIDAILDDFAFLDDWEDRYRYVIELGRTLEPLPDDARNNPANKVEGCVSQVWLDTESAEEDDPIVTFRGDSDALIVRGLIAILFALYSGKRASEIVATDANEVFERLGLRDHLTSQRSNGLSAMIERMRREARSRSGVSA